MSTAIASNDAHLREFQEKVIAKLKADIGEMLPDAVLLNLVERAVDEQFFKERVMDRDYAGRPTSVKASWFVEEVAKLAKPQIQKAVEEYVEENKDQIQKAIDEFVKSENLLLLTFAAIQRGFQGDLYEVANNVITRMKQGY